MSAGDPTFYCHKCNKSYIGFYCPIHANIIGGVYGTSSYKRVDNLERENEVRGADLSEKLAEQEYHAVFSVLMTRYPEGQATNMCIRWLDHVGYDMREMDPEILPCPVCGREASVFETDKKGFGYVQCLYPDCYIKTDKYDNASRAIEHWNSLHRKDNLIAKRGNE